MSLEQALLDRLEKRSLQIAQQHNEINGLRELVDEKMAINEQLAEQITTARLEREQMQHQISELRTERDRIREISKSLVPKSALMQAVQEAAELERQANGLSAEMNSLANQLMDAKAEASGIRGHASSWGCREGETVTAFIQRISMELAEAKTDLAETVALSNAKTLEIRKSMDGHSEDMKAQSELLNKYESLLTKITDLGSYAMTLGRKEGEPLEMFMERQALRLAALESQAGKIGYVAKGEHEEAVTAARENGIHKGESLSGFIWRQCEGLRKSQAENAPLTKLFVVLCKQRGNLNEEIIYRAVDEASDAIKQLTA